MIWTNSPLITVMRKGSLSMMRNGSVVIFPLTPG